MVFLLKYWKIIAVVALLAGTFFAGTRWESNHRDAQLLKERNEAISAYEAEAQRAYKLGRSLEAEKAKRHANESDLRRKLADAISGSDVFARECITDDGLRIVNEIFKGASPAERLDSMPRPTTPNR